MRFWGGDVLLKVDHIWHKVPINLPFGLTKLGFCAVDGFRRRQFMRTGEAD